ncbi:MAG TPA: AfsR/SARP family transcriptional regulator [Gaiellaceae bacterium]
MDEFRLLGPLEVVIGGKPVDIGAAKPRALLALLLLHRNQVVSTERLIDELWADEPPARATKTLQVYISQLRKALGPDRLVTRPPGYLLRVEPGELDLERFEQLAADARKRLANGDATGARDEFREALDLWHGPPEGPAARLEDLRLSAREDWLHAALESGEAAGVIPELEELVASQPLRERPRELLMLALYRSGRQADALELFRRTRELFVNDLGIEPSAALRELEGAMLRQEPALQLRARTPPPDAPERKRSRAWLLVPAAAALAIAGVSAALLVRDGGGTTAKTTTQRANPELRVFVFKLENFLEQSHEGRVAVGRALAGALDCSLSPQVAAAQLDGVQQNRQSLLQQVAALHVPEGEGALSASDLFQRATRSSMAADEIYRDWLRDRTGCPRGSNLPAAARDADVRATALKRQFVRAFNPLARKFGRRIWRADQF